MSKIFSVLPRKKIGAGESGTRGWSWKVQQILHKVILESGAKWLITSSYPESDTLHHKDTAACHNDENLRQRISWFILIPPKSQLCLAEEVS